ARDGARGGDRRDRGGNYWRRVCGRVALLAANRLGRGGRCAVFATARQALTNHRWRHWLVARRADDHRLGGAPRDKDTAAGFARGRIGAADGGSLRGVTLGDRRCTRLRGARGRRDYVGRFAPWRSGGGGFLYGGRFGARGVIGAGLSIEPQWRR